MSLTPDELATISMRRKNAVDWWWEEWQRFRDNYKFFAGQNPFTAEELARAKKTKRALIYFNDLASKINNITGRTVVQKFEPILKGIGDEDAELASILTKSINAIMERGRFSAQDSLSFLDTFVCSLGCTEISRDEFAEGVESLVSENLYPWEVAPERSAKAQNLHDRWYDFRFRRIRKQEAARLFPKAEQIELLESTARSDDASAHTETDVRDYMDGERSFDVDADAYWLAHHQWKEPADKFLVAIPGQDPRQVERPEFEDISRERRSLGLAFERREHYFQLKRYRYREAFLIGADSILDRTIPSFTRSYITCWPWKDEDGTRFFGVVDIGRKPSLWKSKILSLGIDILGVSPKAPLLMEEGVLSDSQELYDRLSDPREIILFKKGSLQGQRPPIMPGPRVSYPPFEQLLQIVSGVLWDSLGIPPGALGQIQDVRRAPAQSIAQVRQLAMATFAHAFDSLSEYRRENARIILLLIAEHFSVEDLVSLLSEDQKAMILTLAGQEEGGLKTLIQRALKFDLVADERPETRVEADQLLEVFPQILGSLNNTLPTFWPFVLTLFHRVGALTQKDVSDLLGMLQQAMAAQPQPEGAEGGEPPPAGAQGTVT